MFDGSSQHWDRADFRDFHVWTVNFFVATGVWFRAFSCATNQAGLVFWWFFFVVCLFCLFCFGLFSFYSVIVWIYFAWKGRDLSSCKSSLGTMACTPQFPWNAGLGMSPLGFGFSWEQGCPCGCEPALSLLHTQTGTNSSCPVPAREPRDLCVCW